MSLAVYLGSFRIYLGLAQMFCKGINDGCELKKKTSQLKYFHSLEFLNRNTKSESSNPIYYIQIGVPSTLAVLIIKTKKLIGLI